MKFTLTAVDLTHSSSRPPSATGRSLEGNARRRQRHRERLIRVGNRDKSLDQQGWRRPAKSLWAVGRSAEIIANAIGRDRQSPGAEVRQQSQVNARTAAMLRCWSLRCNLGMAGRRLRLSVNLAPSARRHAPRIPELLSGLCDSLSAVRPRKQYRRMPPPLPPYQPEIEQVCRTARAEMAARERHTQKQRRDAERRAEHIEQVGEHHARMRD